MEDKNHNVIDRYGILNPDGRGWPHPATYIIDRRGVVRWKFIEVDYRKLPSNEQILSELKKLNSTGGASGRNRPVPMRKSLVH